MMPTPEPLTLIVIDDDENVQQALRTLPFTHPTTVGSVHCHSDLPRQAPVDHRDNTVVILDFWLGRDTYASIHRLREVEAWGLDIVLYTSEERVPILRPAAGLGISTLCLKYDGLASLVATLESLSAGEPVLTRTFAEVLDSLPGVRADLTHAEVQVVRGLACGLDVRDIAAALSKSPHTVTTQIKSVHAKYRASLGDGRISTQQILRATFQDGFWDERLLDEWDQQSP